MRSPISSRATRFIALTIIGITSTSCWSMDTADLTAIGREVGIPVTETPPDETSMQPLASLQVSKSGFYVFGLAPVVEVSLHEAVTALTTLAKERGADGVCNLRYHYNPPHPLKFIVFPLPDWSASVQVFGMAYNALEPSPPTDIERPTWTRPTDPRARPGR